MRPLPLLVLFALLPLAATAQPEPVSRLVDRSFDLASHVELARQWCSRVDREGAAPSDPASEISAVDLAWIPTGADPVQVDLPQPPSRD